VKNALATATRLKMNRPINATLAIKPVCSILSLVLRSSMTTFLLPLIPLSVGRKVELKTVRVK